MIRNKKTLTPEDGLRILANWLQDNVDCESSLIFDNDEDMTDSQMLLECVNEILCNIETSHFFDGS